MCGAVQKEMANSFSFHETPYGVVETVHIFPQQENNIIVFLSIGNPGMLSVYTDFIKKVYDIFEGKLEIFSSSHLGHSQKNLKDGKVYSIDDQVHKTLYFIDLLRSVKPGAKLILIGHSFGSFLNLSALSARPDIAPIFVIHLFPVVCNFKLIPLQKFFCAPNNHNWVSSVVPYLPGKSTLFKLVFPEKLSDTYGEIEKYLSSSAQIKNALAVGNDLSEVISGDMSPEFMAVIRRLKDATCFIFTPFDHYCTKEVFKKMRETLPFARFIALPGQLNVKHNFMCTDEDGVVAEVCAAEIWRKLNEETVVTVEFKDFKNMRERVEEWVVEENKSICH